MARRIRCWWCRLLMHPMSAQWREVWDGEANQCRYAPVCVRCDNEKTTP